MAKKSPKLIGIVVPETHWDRAWYDPFAGYRCRLVKMFDRLLDILRTDPSFENFSFDGQTVVLEDYLDVCPEKFHELAAAVKARRLSVGPWYILPDQFLVSGEALIRNLMIGHEVAARFGRVMKAGYIPDTFGHVTQLPAVLDGFGIDSVIFMRGTDKWIEETGPLFRWIAADGRTSVIGINQWRGYGNLEKWGGNEFERDVFDADLALKQVEDQVDSWLAARTTNRTILFNNGSDHLRAQRAVPAMIRSVNRRSKRIKLIQADFEEYVDRVRAEGKRLRTYQGEIHSGYNSNILSGTFSARMWIKQMNWAGQKELEEVAEPIQTRIWLEGFQHHQPLLTKAWKHLLKCHPHDDICGCSVDATHEDNRYEFKMARETVEFLNREALWKEGALLDIPEDALKAAVVYNGSFHEGSREIAGVVSFTQEQSVPKRVCMEAPDGRKLPATLKPMDYPAAYNLTQAPRNTDVNLYKLEMFEPEMPPAAARAYVMRPGGPDWKAPDLKADGASIENAHYKVTIRANGAVNVRDKDTGLTYRGLNMFEDDEDCGDSYDHSPLPKKRGRTITSAKCKAKIGKPALTPWSVSLTADLKLDVPEALNADRTARARKTTPVSVRTTVTLTSGCKRVDFRTSMNNTAKDHRFRVVFPSPIATNKVHAAQHFDVLTRPVDPTRGTKKDWQPGVATQHMDEFVSINDREHGLTLAAVGLPEYEARKGAKGTELVLTLLRSFGWLSRDDFITRRGGAGPGFATPEGQCLGDWTFEYAVIPHAGDWLSSEAHVQARRLSSKPVLFELNVPSDTRSELGGETATRLPESLFSIGPVEAVVTSAKRTQDGSGVAIRFFNIGDKPIKAELTLHFPADAAHLARADETRLKPLRLTKAGKITLPARPKEIVTVVCDVSGLPEEDFHYRTW
jgi:2-O-(6-phospho-alpha-D-mannosyl)-D-glycerate hydrolase